MSPGVILEVVINSALSSNFALLRHAAALAREAAYPMEYSTCRAVAYIMGSQEVEECAVSLSNDAVWPFGDSSDYFHPPIIDTLFGPRRYPELFAADEMCHHTMWLAINAMNRLPKLRPQQMTPSSSTSLSVQYRIILLAGLNMLTLSRIKMVLRDEQTLFIVGGYYELKIDRVVSSVEEEDAPEICGCVTRRHTRFYLIDYDTSSNAESEFEDEMDTMGVDSPAILVRASGRELVSLAIVRINRPIHFSSDEEGSLNNTIEID